MFSFSAFVGAAVCLAPVQAQAPKKPVATESYFPIKLGATWTYEVVAPQANSGEVQTFTQEVKVVKTTKANPGFYVALEHRENGALARIEKYYVTPAGVLRIAGGENASEKLTPPLPLLRFPLLPEKTWKWKGKIVVKSGSGDAEATMSVSGPEEVEVSAGKFAALQVHCEQILYGRLNGKPTRAALPVDYWFAPGVGLVQRKVRLPYTTVDIRLKSFKIEP